MKWGRTRGYMDEYFGKDFQYICDLENWLDYMNYYFYVGYESVYVDYEDYEYYEYDKPLFHAEKSEELYDFEFFRFHQRNAYLDYILGKTRQASVSFENKTG